MKSFCGNCLSITLFIALMAILMALLVIPFAIERTYSMTQIANHTTERQTFTLRLKYYVNENFDEKFGHRLNEFETEIETQFVRKKFEMCLKELQSKRTLILGAIAFGNEELEQKSRLQRLNSCPEL